MAQVAEVTANLVKKNRKLQARCKKEKKAREASEAMAQLPDEEKVDEGERSETDSIKAMTAQMGNSVVISDVIAIDPSDDPGELSV